MLHTLTTIIQSKHIRVAENKKLLQILTMVLPLILAGLLAASNVAVGTAGIVGLVQDHNKKQNE